MILLFVMTMFYIFSVKLDIIIIVLEKVLGSTCSAISNCFFFIGRYVLRF